MVVVLSFLVVHSPVVFGDDAVSWREGYQGGQIYFQAEYATETGTEVREATLPGELFQPPVPVRRVSKERVSRKTPLTAVESDWSAQLAKDPDWILANYAKVTESDQLWRDLLSQPHAQEMEHQGAIAGGQLYLLGWAALDRFVLLLEEDDANRRAIAFVWEDGEWKHTVTPQLHSAFPLFHVVYAALQYGVFESVGSQHKAQPAQTGGEVLASALRPQPDTEHQVAVQVPIATVRTVLMNALKSHGFVIDREERTDPPSPRRTFLLNMSIGEPCLVDLVGHGSMTIIGSQCSKGDYAKLAAVVKETQEQATRSTEPPLPMLGADQPHVQEDGSRWVRVREDE